MDAIQVTKLIDSMPVKDGYEVLVMECKALTTLKNQVLAVKFPLSAKAKVTPLPFNIHVIVDIHGIHFHSFVTND